MKLLSLNIWGGKIYPEIINFLQRYVGIVDIFCFQEVFDTKEHIEKYHFVRTNIWQELSQLFMDYHKFYDPRMKGYDSDGHMVHFDFTTGLGVFVKREMEIVDEIDYFTYRKKVCLYSA